MNLYGSYRALRNNSQAAMLAAIEIYNKPQISYREESFVILLVNSWELLLKAILSKNRVRIYYPKKHGEPYKTLSFADALLKVKAYVEQEIQFEAVSANLRLLLQYRNNVIHFYSQRGFGVLIYGLSQTSIVNFRDLTLSIFGVDIAEEITINLLPLALGSPPDPIQFLQRANKNPPKNKIVSDFIQEIVNTTKCLEGETVDTSRFLTLYEVNLQSIKKVAAADIVVGIDADSDDTGQVLVQKRVDPNITHPLRRKDILEQIGPSLRERRFNQRTFEAIAWKYRIKETPHHCWKSDTGGVTKYSRDIIPFVKKLSGADIDQAQADYSAFLTEKKKPNLASAAHNG